MMTPPIIIRPFRPDDLDETSAVDREAFGNDSYPTFFFRQAFDVFGDLLRVAEDENKNIVGYTLGAFQPSTTTGWILALAVRTHYRQMGVATLLTQDLLQVLREKGVRSVKLTVQPANNPAISLYRKIGFYELDKADEYFGYNEPRIVMQKDLG